MHSEPNQSFTNRERKETTQRLRRETKKKKEKSHLTHTLRLKQDWEKKKEGFCQISNGSSGFFLSERKLCITKMSYTSSIRVFTIVASMIVLISVSTYHVYTSVIIATYNQRRKNYIHFVDTIWISLNFSQPLWYFLNLFELLRTSPNFSELLQTNLNLSGPLRTFMNLSELNFIVFGKKISMEL